MKMKKMFAVIISAVLVMGLVACGASPSPGGEGGAAAPAQVVRADLGMFYDVNSPAGIASLWLAEEAYRRSNGTLDIAVYTNNAIGDENAMLLAVRAGDLEMTLAGAAGVSMFTPTFVFLMAPYSMQSVEHFYNIFNGPLGDQFREEMLAVNNRIMGTFFRGYRNLIADRPVRTPDDFIGLSMRVPQAHSFLVVFSGLGATTVPVALAEVYGALQTGVVSATEGPSEMLAPNQFHEVTSYFMRTQHIVDIAYMHVNDSWFQSLSDEHQRILEDVITEAMQMASDLTYEADQRFTEQLLERLTEIEVDREAFAELADPVLRQLFIDEGVEISFEEIMAFA